jgi:hypothetical protein
MPPADEAYFISVWQDGIETAEIGSQFGIPPSTLSSHAHTLVRPNKIQSRPKGGASPGSTPRGGIAHPQQCRDQCNPSTPL